MTVTVSNLQKNTTLEEYAGSYTGGKFSFTDYKLEEFGNTTLAGLPAKKIVFSYLGDYQGQDQYIKSLSVITISGNNAYEISYHSPRLEFDDLMPAVQQIIDSLKIFPMPPCNFVRDEPLSSEGKCVLRPSTMQPASNSYPSQDIRRDVND